MRHIVYSLATFALVANGASTSTSSTVSSPPMAPAVPAVPAVPAAPAAPAAPSAPQSGSPQLEVPIIPTLEPVGASASGSAGGASGSASGSAGGGMGSGGASASGSANANAGNAEAGAGAGASASSGETTSAPPATTSAPPAPATTAAPPATTSAPDGTATAVPASGDSTTAGPGDTSATTSSPGGTATAVPAGPADATAPPAADTTAAPAETTAAPPAETTSAPAETTAAPNDGATAAPADDPNANGLTGPTASIDTPAALTKGALVPPAGFLPNVLPDGIATVSNLIPGPLVGYLDNAWVRNWNSIWTGTWWGTLIGYGNVNLPLLGPLNIYAPQTLSSWTLGNPENRYGPGWGAGTMVYPALSAQKWWSSGHRFSWSFLPLPTIPGWTFSSEMRGCILNEIEKRVQIYDTRIAPGWLVPGSGNPVATDIAWGYTNAVYWLSWVLPFGAPNTPISNKNYVAPILSILKTPEFYSAIENGCHIPFSNFTVLSKEIKYQGNSWATTDTRVDMTEPIVGAAPSSFSPFQIMAIPFLSLAALLRGN